MPHGEFCITALEVNQNKMGCGATDFLHHWLTMRGLPNAGYYAFKFDEDFYRFHWSDGTEYPSLAYRKGLKEEGWFISDCYLI